jgi:hypothetical protein
MSLSLFHRIAAALFVLVAAEGTVPAEELPRKTKTPRESYPNVDVIYDSIVAPHGKRLRTIITKPHCKGQAAGNFCGRLAQLRFGRSARRYQGRKRTCVPRSRAAARLLFVSRR